MSPVSRTDAGSTTAVPASPRVVEEAVLREAPALLAYLTRRVSDPADAADLLGDVLVVVWRRIDTMPQEPDQARMWMFTIARKTLAGGHRTIRRRRALTERLRHELTVTATANLAGNPQHSPTDPRTERLTLALDQLKPADREILSLIHWDSFTLIEAAQHLHLRHTTTRSRYRRARTRLRRLLEADQPSNSFQSDRSR